MAGSGEGDDAAASGEGGEAACAAGGTAPGAATGGAPLGGTPSSWLQGTCRVAGAHVKAGNCAQRGRARVSRMRKQATGPQAGARAVNETSPRTLPEKAVITTLRVLMASEWPFQVGQIGSVPCAAHAH